MKNNDRTNTVLRGQRASRGHVHISPDSLTWHPSEHPGEEPPSAKIQRPSIDKSDTDTWPGRP